MAEIKLHSACQLWQPTMTLSMLPKTNIWANLLRGILTIQNADKKRAASGKVLFADKLHFQPFYGAVFTGPAGNGRHSTAAALAGSMPKDLCHIRIYGSDLDYESPDEAIAAMASLGYAANGESGLCLLVDEPQDCRHSRMIQTRILRIMERAQVPVYVIIVTDQPESVLPGLKQRLMLCHCSKPTEQQRRAWLEHEFATSVPVQFSDTNAAWLASKTDDFSWLQLQQFAGYLRQKMFSNTMQMKDYTTNLSRIGLLESGGVQLSDAEIQPYLKSLQDQVEASKPAAASMPVQMFTVPQPGAAQEETTESMAQDVIDNGEQKMNRSALEQQMMLHENPEDMTYDQLTSNLGLDYSYVDKYESDEE